jgi:copper chaperone CopZ
MNDSCKIEPIDRIPSEEEKNSVKFIYLVTFGLNCPNCAMRVRNALISTSGIIDVKIDYFDGMTEVAYNPSLIERSTVPELISNAGDGGHHKYSAQIIG